MTQNNNSSVEISIPNINHLELAMKNAESFNEWKELAEAHDELSGGNQWKISDNTDRYDFSEVKNRLEKMQMLLAQKNAKELLFVMNEGLHGNLSGMGHATLYSQTKIGTKQLIEDFVETTVQALDFLYQSPDSELSQATKQDFFQRANHCYGRPALMISGAAGLIYFHHGVVQELLHQNLLPNIISGASAGALVTAQLGCIDKETLKSDHFLTTRYPDEHSMVDLFLGRLTQQAAKDLKEAFLDKACPRDLTFREALEKTGRHINISISPTGKFQNSRLLNAYTAPDVYVRSAVSASISVPGVFAPEQLYTKSYDGKPRPYLKNTRWVDGSLAGDLPAKRLARLYGVNFFISSVANPLIAPFISEPKYQHRNGLKKTVSRSSIDLMRELLAITEKTIANDSNRNTINTFRNLINIMEQRYKGDITFAIEKKDFTWRNLIGEFTEAERENLLVSGARSSWPKLSRLKTSIRIAQRLEEIQTALFKQKHSV